MQREEWYHPGIMKLRAIFSAPPFIVFLVCLFAYPVFSQSTTSASKHAVVLHAARLLDIESGKIITPGEVLVQDERILEVGSSVKRPPSAEVLELGDTTLMPGLIDVHVHLFLHPGAEASTDGLKVNPVPQRTIIDVTRGPR